MGLRNLGEMKDVGVHAADDLASFVFAGDRCPEGVSVSGVRPRVGLAGMEISSDSGRSSIKVESLGVGVGGEGE